MECGHCGEYTNRCDAFGYALCAECHEAEDDAVESAERRTAKKHGFDTAYYAEADRAAAVRREEYRRQHL